MSERHYALSEKDTWQTPDWLIEGIQQYVNIDLDPCAGKHTSIGDENYRLEDGKDGLELPWYGTTFVNPPFSHKKEWAAKVIDELDNTDLIMLVTPDSTDVQSWWHTCIVPFADYVWFSEGRIKYVDPDTQETAKSPTFGTAISMYGEVPDGLLQWFNEHGWVVEDAVP
jgi:phage N-6-adenine-methyltransferase